MWVSDKLPPLVILSGITCCPVAGTMTRGVSISIVPPTTPVRDRVGDVGIGMQILFTRVIPRCTTTHVVPVALSGASSGCLRALLSTLKP